MLSGLNYFWLPVSAFNLPVSHLKRLQNLETACLDR
jgi:hypothetical protein